MQNQTLKTTNDARNAKPKASNVNKASSKDFELEYEGYEEVERGSEERIKNFRIEYRINYRVIRMSKEERCGMIDARV
jgi:hypothetical protein